MRPQFIKSVLALANIFLGLASYGAATASDANAFTNEIVFTNERDFAVQFRAVYLAAAEREKNLLQARLKSLPPGLAEYLTAAPHSTFPTNSIWPITQGEFFPEGQWLLNKPATASAAWGPYRGVVKGMARTQSRLSGWNLTADTGDRFDPIYLARVENEINGVCTEFMCNPQSGNLPVDHFVAWRENYIIPLEEFAKAVESARKAEEYQFYADDNERSTRLRRLLVAIVQEEAGGVRNFAGSGFIYQDRLYTCVHVLSDWFVNKDTRRVFTNAANVTVLFQGKNFEDAVAMNVPVVRSNLFPEDDVAVIPLQGQVRELAMNITAQVTNDFIPGGEDDMKFGSVLIYGARQEPARTGPIRIRWSGPDNQVYFPPRIIKRIKGDFTVTYAYNNHLDGLNALALRNGKIGLEYDLWKKALEPFMQPDPHNCGYNECRPEGNIEICSLVYIPEHYSLTTLSTDAGFKQSPRIKCFGTGLSCKDGMSGAPVFKITPTKHILMGLYAGISRLNESNQIKPTLDCFGKAIPFKTILELK